MNAVIVQQEDRFILKIGEAMSFHLTLEDVKAAAHAFQQAMEWAAKEVPRPPLGPKEWSPRGRRGVIPEAR